jgi:hypothetical protein
MDPKIMAQCHISRYLDETRATGKGPLGKFQFNLVSFRPNDVAFPTKLAVCGPARSSHPPVTLI